MTLFFWLELIVVSGWKNISYAINPLLNCILEVVAVVNALAHSRTKMTWPIPPAASTINMLLTILIPDCHWSAGGVGGRGGGLLEPCIYKQERRVLQQSQPAEPSNSTGKGRGGRSEKESRRERERVMQLPCRLRCILSGPGGCTRERGRETDTETKWENEIEPITIDRAQGIHP